MSLGGGHRIFIALQSKRLWDAFISFCSVSVRYCISELDKTMLAMQAFNVLILNFVSICLNLKHFTHFSKSCYVSVTIKA